MFLLGTIRGLTEVCGTLLVHSVSNTFVKQLTFHGLIAFYNKNNVVTKVTL